MKKFTSTVLTVIILIISVFSVNAFAQEQTRAEKWMQNFGNHELEIKATSYYAGQKTVSKLYIKGKNIAAISTLPLSKHYTAEIKAVIKDGYSYLYLTSFPFLHIKVKTDDNIFQSINPIELIYLKSYELQDGSTTYYVEEFTYKNSDALIKYYFVGDKLMRIESDGTDEYGDYSSSVIEILSDNVDDSKFRVPFFSINISPLIDYFYS